MSRILLHTPAPSRGGLEMGCLDAGTAAGTRYFAGMGMMASTGYRAHHLIPARGVSGDTIGFLMRIGVETRREE
jgi:hypothetical protein